MRTYRLAIYLLLILSAACAHAETAAGTDRGVWFWQSPSSPYGSSTIVGDAAREDQTIANLKKWQITTVYGSYAHAAENAAALRAWNRKLSAHGIASYLLFSETDDIFADHWPAASATLMTEFVTFNRAAQPEERFAGVAFDIEPHILPQSAEHRSWKDADGAQRRIYVGGLLDFLEKVRALLDASGERNARIQTSLTTWFYKMGDKIAWANTGDRDAWFAGLAKVCDRVSVMDFEISSTQTILDRVQDESALLHGTMRIALRANLGKEWKSVFEFWNAVHTVEAQSRQSIDIQDYALLCADQAN